MATITSSSVADPTVITATGHGFSTGDTVKIIGHSGSTPDINGNWRITVVDADTFTIPVAVTTGGTNGTATLVSQVQVPLSVRTISTTALADAYVGAYPGEPAWVVDSKELRIYDGTSAGGTLVSGKRENLGFPSAIPADESVLRSDGTSYVVATNLRADAGTANSGTEMGTGVANGDKAVAEGLSTTASGDNSHAEGLSTTASGDNSHAEGRDTIASGFRSHAEGFESQANGNQSHAEGESTTASGSSSHAEGTFTTASGSSSHAEGGNTTASGDYSSATGRKANAIHNGARVEADSQFVDVSSTTTDQFTARFQNGYEFKGGAANFDGGVKSPTTEVTTTAYTALVTDSIILVDDDTAGAEATVTLPAAATAGDGYNVVILKKGSTANVVIDGNGTETINGALTQTLTTQYSKHKLLSDGTAWFII